MGVLIVLCALALPAAASAAAPANDMIANAQVVGPAMPMGVNGTTIGATGEPGEIAGGNPVSASVWYRWTAPSAGKVQADLCTGVNHEPLSDVVFGMGVYTGGDTWRSLTKVVSSAGPCKVTFDAAAGETYKIQVAFLAGGEYSFRLDLHPPNPPANDNFAAAGVLASKLPVTARGSTVDATAEAGEPSILGGSERRTVWYRWTAPRTGQVQVNVCDFEIQPGSNANLAFGMYTGTTLAGLVPVAETDGSSSQCTVLADVTKGTEYRIGIGMYFGGEGEFTLAIRSAAPPENDAFANATAVEGLPVRLEGDNGFATPEPDEPAMGGFPGDRSAHSVWYRWTAPASATVEIGACSRYQTRLSVYTGTTLSGLVETGDLPGYAPYCQVSLAAVKGTTYVIGVTADSWRNNGGVFALDIHRFAVPPNDLFANSRAVGPALPVRVNGTNSDAGIEPGEPGFPGDEYSHLFATVWYSWASRFRGPVEVSACGSDVIPVVYTGSLLSNLDPKAPLSPDDVSACPGQPGMKVKLRASRGTVYRIKVDGQDRNLSGPFRLTIRDPKARTRLHRQMKRAIKKCRKRFKMKGSKAHRKKMRRKRSGCIRRTRRKFSIRICREISRDSSRKRCLKRARAGHGVKPRTRHHR